jgi:hypothetical protein
MQCPRFICEESLISSAARISPMGESTLFHTHVQNDPGHAAYASSTECGAPFRFSVTDPAGEFNDAVMDLNTDRACQQVCITFKFSENLLLN